MRPAIDIDSLPNPHLLSFLDPSYTEVDYSTRDICEQYRFAYGAHWSKLGRAERRAILPLRAAHLRAAGLPADYDDLSEGAQYKARMTVLNSWFDPNRAEQLCTDTEQFIHAFYLWVEHYEKGSEYSQGFYTFRDSKVKYDLVRYAMSPPKVPDEPAKTVFHCPRGTTKTITIIRQMCKMMAIVRPYTKILVSEIEGERTKEEIGYIRDDVQNNELIHADFGGAGKLWPANARSGKKWSLKKLEFTHLPGCEISGHSFASAQRGRHPHFVVLDDIEDESTIGDSSYRRKLFKNIIARYLGMLYKGGKLVWMGTTIPNSCIAMVLKERAQRADDEDYIEDDVAELLDTKFRDWHKYRVGMIRTRADGSVESIMTDHTSVDGYQRAIETRGASIVSAEMAGDPLPAGEFALHRDPRKHGYMHCVRENKQGFQEEYFLDLHTGQTMPWQEFVDSLFTATGTDLADSTADDADPGACVAVGVNPATKVYVLDAIITRRVADEWPEISMDMAEYWNAARSGFEVGAMQRVVYRMAKRLRAKREAEGKMCSKPVPIVNAGQNKHQRVLATLRPLYRDAKIAFPHLEPVEIGGVIHTPMKHEHARSITTLKNQLDEYTDEGPSGHDDGADALQMAIRTAGGNRGKEDEPVDQREVAVKKWERVGLTVNPWHIPEEAWTDEMRKRMNEDESVDTRAEIREKVAAGKYVEDNPWD